MADIESVAANTVLDVIGVGESVSEITGIVTRMGMQTDKRVLHIKDQSNASIEVHSAACCDFVSVCRHTVVPEDTSAAGFMMARILRDRQESSCFSLPIIR